MGLGEVKGHLQGHTAAESGVLNPVLPFLRSTLDERPGLTLDVPSVAKMSMGNPEALPRCVQSEAVLGDPFSSMAQPAAAYPFTTLGDVFSFYLAATRLQQQPSDSRSASSSTALPIHCRGKPSPALPPGALQHRAPFQSGPAPATSCCAPHPAWGEANFIPFQGIIIGACAVN